MPATQTFEVIANYVAPSNVQNITISGLNQGYDHLVITCGFTRSLIGDFGGRGAEFQFNGVTSGYYNVGIGSGGTGNAVGGTNGFSNIAFNATAGNATGQGNRPPFEAWIPNYTSATSYNKVALTRLSYQDSNANTGGGMGESVTVMPITGALTSIFIFEQVDTFVTGDWVTIYGVKNG
jgi:hypothetical protein